MLGGIRTLQSRVDKCVHICLILSKEAPLAKMALLPEKQLVHRFVLLAASVRAL